MLVKTVRPTSCCVSAGYWEVQLIHPPDNYYRILGVWPRNPGAEAEVQQSSMCADCYQSSTTRRREPRKKNQSMIKDQLVTSWLYPYWYSANRKFNTQVEGRKDSNFDFYYVNLVGVELRQTNLFNHTSWDQYNIERGYKVHALFNCLA